RHLDGEGVCDRGRQGDAGDHDPDPLTPADPAYRSPLSISQTYAQPMRKSCCLRDNVIRSCGALELILWAHRGGFLSCPAHPHASTSSATSRTRPLAAWRCGCEALGCSSSSSPSSTSSSPSW